MAKGLYKFYWDQGRMGDVEGAFVVDSAALEKAMGKTIYFGEILGKHSEVYGVLEPDDFTLVTDDEKAIEALGDFTVGHNPFHHMEEYEDDEAEDED